MPVTPGNAIDVALSSLGLVVEGTDGVAGARVAQAASQRAIGAQDAREITSTSLAHRADADHRDSAEALPGSPWRGTVTPMRATPHVLAASLLAVTTLRVAFAGDEFRLGYAEALALARDRAPAIAVARGREGVSGAEARAVGIYPN